MGLLETGQCIAAGKPTARILPSRCGRARNAAGPCLRLSRCIARLAMDVRSAALARASHRGVAGALHAKRSFCGLPAECPLLRCASRGCKRWQRATSLACCVARSCREALHSRAITAPLPVSERCLQPEWPVRRSSPHTEQEPAWQARAPWKRATAMARLPTADVTVSGRGPSQPAIDAAHSAAPPAKASITAAFFRAGPNRSIAEPKITVPIQIPCSTPSESAKAGAAATSTGVSAQCSAHQLAAHAAIRDPEARYVREWTVARALFMVSLARL